MISHPLPLCIQVVPPVNCLASNYFRQQLTSGDSLLSVQFLEPVIHVAERAK